jgi:hypothetical protein
MSQRRGRRRALREIARHLADSEPGLHRLFLAFNDHVSGEEMPPAEQISRSLPGLIARIGRQVRPASADFYGMVDWRM